MFIHHAGRRRAKKIGDRTTANEVARRIRERLALGDLSLLASEAAETFEAFAIRWLEGGESGRKASTHRFYAFNLKLHIVPTLGARPITAVSRADCRELLAGARQKGLKRASPRHYRRISRLRRSRASRPGGSCRCGCSRHPRALTSTVATCDTGYSIGCSRAPSSRDSIPRPAAHVRVAAHSERRAADLRERADGAQLDPGDRRCLRAPGPSANRAAVDKLDALPARNPDATDAQNADANVGGK